jgi:hypothetical protein
MLWASMPAALFWITSISGVSDLPPVVHAAFPLMAGWDGLFPFAGHHHQQVAANCAEFSAPVNRNFYR